MYRKAVLIALGACIVASSALCGLIPTPLGSDLEFLGEVSLTEAYDVTLNCNATSFCADLVEYKCYSLKVGYNIEKTRWVLGTGVSINGFAMELREWTGWDLTVPILDQLGIDTIFLITYSPEVLPTWTFQVGANWEVIDF